MSGYYTLKLCKALDGLEHRIKSAEVVTVQYHQSEQDLAIRKLIEYAKPTKTLDEVANKEPIVSSESKETSTEELTSEEFKTSFREVLRLAKSGQQAWWTDKLKESTNAHIECMDEYYRKNYNDEKID